MWQAALAVGSGIMGSRAKRKAARAARRDAERQAAEIRRQRFAVSELATQQHEQRSEAFKELAAYNQAMAAYSGRTDRSIAALRGEEERRYGRDVDRLRAQERREKESLEKQAQATLARGKVTSDVYRQQARQSLFDTAFKIASLS